MLFKLLSASLGFGVQVYCEVKPFGPVLETFEHKPGFGVPVYYEVKPRGQFWGRFSLTQVGAEAILRPFSLT